jgi:hypothetical protein
MGDLMSKVGETAALVANSKAIKGLKMVLTAFLAFITLFGLIGFSLFILEESSQVLMFSSWQAIDAHRWDIVLEGVDLMIATNDMLKGINKYVGWINPLSFLSYGAYGEATDTYIKALMSRILANDPGLFVGRKVGFTFKPQRTENLSNGSYMHVNRNLSVITQNMVDNKGYVRAEGILNRVGNKLIVDTTKKEQADKRLEGK